MTNEEEYANISNELELQQSKGEAIRQQIQAMQSNIMEIGAAMDAVKNLPKVKGDTLVPIGAGVFMSCPKPDAEKVIMSIGAGIMVQKKPEDALKLLEDRQKKMTDAINAAQGDLSEVANAMEQLTERAQMIGAAEERANVRASKE